MTNDKITILIGLAVAQVLATLHVFLSNTELFHTLEAVTGAGYLAVPNTHVMQSLKEFWPAFFGGIFFTLSIGTFLTLFSFAVIRIWDCITGQSNIFLIMVLTFWLLCIATVNNNGICLIGSTHFVLIPAVVFGAMVIGKRKAESGVQNKENPEIGIQKSEFRNLIIHLIFFFVLAFAGSAVITEDIFVKIRDNFFLSNPVGIKLNNFYYKYTLYPAEVFKPEIKKQMRICSFSSFDDKALILRMKKRLLNYNYLVLDKEADKVNLHIAKQGPNLVFKKKNTIILKTTPRKFLSKPWQVLKEFSEKNDRHVFFRWLTFLSIQILCAVGLYLILYIPFRIISGLFLTRAYASPAAGALCLLLGLALLVFISSDEKANINTNNLVRILESDNWHKRVAALQFIEERGMETDKYPAHVKMMKSPHIPERFWLAKALGHSRSPETYHELLKLLEDSNFNVVYSAFEALGRRGEKKAAGEILKRIKTSDNWYVQLYAYKALRRLGWKQMKFVPSLPISD